MRHDDDILVGGWWAGMPAGRTVCRAAQRRWSAIFKRLGSARVSLSLAAESQTFNHLSVFFSLYKLILAYNP